MILWHGTQDTQRIPELVAAGQSVQIWIGTYPIESGQRIVVSWEVFKVGVRREVNAIPANWHHNDTGSGNSYWLAELGPFEAGETIQYSIFGAGPDGPIEEQSSEFSVTVPTANERELRVRLEA